MAMRDLGKVKTILEDRSPRSAWNRGVNQYAIEMVEDMLDSDISWAAFKYMGTAKMLRTAIMHGEKRWRDYSDFCVGVAMQENEEIAKRLCTPSELKYNKYGQRNPNKFETWQQQQARALEQACSLVISIAFYDYIA